MGSLRISLIQAAFLLDKTLSNSEKSFLRLNYYSLQKEKKVGNFKLNSWKSKFQ